MKSRKSSMFSKEVVLEHDGGTGNLCLIECLFVGKLKGIVGLSGRKHNRHLSYFFHFRQPGLAFYPLFFGTIKSHCLLLELGIIHHEIC